MAVRYKRTKYDSPLRCPYCGHQFSLFGMEQVAAYKSDIDKPWTWPKRQCKHCYQTCYYYNVTAKYAADHKFKATYSKEEIAMTIFSNKIEELEAAENVYNTLDYNLKDRIDQNEYYESRAKENADANEEYDEDNYLVRSARQAERQAKLFKELMDYIEKKYLK